MLLKNTSRYDTKLVRQIVKVAAGEIEIGDVAINVKNSLEHYAGRAYPSIPSGEYESPWLRKYDKKTGNAKARYLIVCRVGGPEKFPYQCKGYPGRKIENGNWPTPLLADWMECMVMLVAHELMHIQQFRSKARCSEQETEAFAMRRLEAWRGAPALPELKQAPVARPKEAVLAGKMGHAQAMLAKNLTKLRRAETLVKKWQAKVKRYQRKVDTSNLTNAASSGSM